MVLLSYYVSLANTCLHYGELEVPPFLGPRTGQPDFCCPHWNLPSPSATSPRAHSMAWTRLLLKLCRFCVTTFWLLSLSDLDFCESEHTWPFPSFCIMIWILLLVCFCIILAKNSILDACHWQHWPYWWLDMLKIFSKSMKLYGINRSCRIH